MSKRIISLFAVLPFVLLLTPPAHAAAPMYIPAPIEVPAGKSVEEVKRSVRKALFDEEFQTREIGPGEVQGKRTKSGKNGAYSAVVSVTYDSRTVRIVYKDSENLRYDSKNQTIHGTYNRWARNIEKRVRRNLGAY
jgi:hypothetical protein